MSEEDFYALNLKKGNFIKITFTQESGNPITKNIEIYRENLTDTIHASEGIKYQPPEILYVGDSPYGNGIPLWQVDTIEKI